MEPTPRPGTLQYIDAMIDEGLQCTVPTSETSRPRNRKT